MNVFETTSMEIYPNSPMDLMGGINFLEVDRVEKQHFMMLLDVPSSTKIVKILQNCGADSDPFQLLSFLPLAHR